MIKKSLALLTLTAATVEGKGYNFWEQPTSPRILKATECGDDSQCQSVSKSAICMNQKVSTETQKVCIAQTTCTTDKHCEKLGDKEKCTDTHVHGKGMKLCMIQGDIYSPDYIPPDQCIDDAQCQKINPFQRCKDTGKYDKPHYICAHKDLFPLEPKEWVGTIVFASFMLLANVGGIGGGGVAIPLAMTFFNLSMKPAVAISSFSIMMSTLARFFFNFDEKHPEKDGMISIDYGLTIVMMPLNLIGSLIGALFLVMFPDLILMVILTLLLLVLAIECARKYKVMRAAEDEKERLKKGGKPKEIEMKDKEDSDAPKGASNKIVDGDVALSARPLTGTDDENKAEVPATSINADGSDKEDKYNKDECDERGLPYRVDDIDQNDRLQELRSLVKQEKSHGVWKKQLINFGELLFLIGISFLRGTPGFEKCSVGDWSLFAAFIIIMGVFVVVGTRLVAHEQALKREFNNINLAKNDLIFEGGTLRMVLALGFGGGWVAGALGLGGGVIFNPLLMSLGVPPKVSSATGMYMITFSKIATCTIYFVNGKLIPDYALWIAAWSMLGSVIGLRGANIYMAKSDRQSIIVLFLTIVLALSVIGVPIFGGLDLKNASDHGKNILAFKNLCVQHADHH